MHATTHQRQLYLILHFFNMERAARRLVAQQCVHHCGGDLMHLVTHTRGCCFVAAVNGDKCLRHGNRNFLGLERRYRAITTNDLVIGISRLTTTGGVRVAVGRHQRICEGVHRIDIGTKSHGCLHFSIYFCLLTTTSPYKPHETGELLARSLLISTPEWRRRSH